MPRMYTSLNWREEEFAERELQEQYYLEAEEQRERAEAQLAIEEWAESIYCMIEDAQLAADAADANAWIEIRKAA